MKAPIKAANTCAEIIGIADTQSDSALELPLYLCPAEAGFPSPADDFVEQRLNLHKHLVRNEAATFFVRAHGESMINAGIMDGDLLVVDRSVPAEHNRIVIAALEGELTVKKLVRRKERVFLAPANPEYPDFEITHSEYVHIVQPPKGNPLQMRVICLPACRVSWLSCFLVSELTCDVDKGAGMGPAENGPARSSSEADPIPVTKC